MHKVEIYVYFELNGYWKFVFVIYFN